MDTVCLTLHIDPGTEGSDLDPTNPLSRALGRLLLDGQPFSHLAYCYFGYEDTIPTTHPNLRWLGVFVLSAGERVIFFPGFSISPSWIRTLQGKSVLGHKDFDLDHVSLEKGSRKWHFTSPRSKKHYAGGFTTPLESKQFLWFGMSVANDSFLRELKRETMVISRAPSSDSDRRIHNIAKANDQATHHVILLPKGAQQLNKDGFLHFAFVASPKGAPLYHGSNLGLPIGSPFLMEPLPEGLLQLPTRTHSVFLSTKIEIQITSMWLPGALNIPITFTTRNRR